jgi:transposase
VLATNWPEQAMRALCALIRAWHAARDHDLPAVPDDARSPLELEFRRAVTVGLAAVRRVPDPRTAVRQQPGRELLEFCRDHEGDVLRFARDTSIWPTNNLSEVRHEVARVEWVTRKEGRLMMAAG